MAATKNLILELLWAILYVAAVWFLSASWEVAALFGLGLAGGIALLFADATWLYRYYQSRGDRAAFQPLITRSVLFLAAFVLLSIFVVTSSGSLIGMGIILGLGAGLLTEMVLLRRDAVVFQAVFLSDVKMRVTTTQVNRLVAGFAVLQAVLSAFVLMGV